MTLEQENNVITKEISVIIQKIQDNTIPRPELGNFDMRDHHLYWELGIKIKKFVQLNRIPEDKIIGIILQNFRDIEKKIRNDGKRKGKESFPTWIMESKLTKKKRSPDKPWIQLCWEFVDEYQDEERWNLVAYLSGDKFKDNDGKTLFTRKFAEDLRPYFSKKNPIQDAEKLQKQFIKEIEKFDRKPSRESEWEPLKKRIFGKSKIDLIEASDNFSSIRSEVDELVDPNTSNSKLREQFVNYVGKNAIDSLRSLLVLISLNDEKFEKRLKQLGKISPTIKTQNTETKGLYQTLYTLIRDTDSRKKFRMRISPYDLTTLNTKLKAVTSDDNFSEYQQNLKLSQEFFN